MGKHCPHGLGRKAWCTICNGREAEERIASKRTFAPAPPDAGPPLAARLLRRPSAVPPPADLYDRRGGPRGRDKDPAGRQAPRPIRGSQARPFPRQPKRTARPWAGRVGRSPL